MNINFRKVSAIASSALMAVSSVGFAAAASYPAPFVVGGSANVAIVYGTGEGVSSLDVIQAGNIQTNLQSFMGGSGSSGGSSTVSGGDNVLLAKSSDNLNINNTWSVFTGTIDDDDLSTLLADGTYIADDNDEFDYEQKIKIGTPEMTFFRDSDYEGLVGLDERTPIVGFQISSNTFILNYTMEFLEDVTTDYTSSGRADDIEGSDIPMMGRTYYVSKLVNGSNTASYSQMIVLDSANIGNVKEGETVTISDKEVYIDFIDTTNVVLMVDGQRAPKSGKLTAGDSFKLSDNSYLGVRDVTKLAVSGEIGSASFSIGSGKLEFPSHGAEIKLNDDAVGGVRGYLHKTSDKLDKIVIEWKTDDDEFLTPGSELIMPGFGALKFTMNELVRNEEEKITIEEDSDTSVQMTVPIKSGIVNFNFLYSDTTTGNFTGIGKAADERLLASNASTITFFEKRGGSDYHKYFFATYNISKEGQSYLLRAKVSEDTTAGRNETTIQSYDSTYTGEGAPWKDVCKEKANTNACDIGDVSLTLNNMNYTSGDDESVDITAGTNVNFHYIVTPGGLSIFLPFTGKATDAGTNFTYGEDNLTTVAGLIDLSGNQSTAGYSSSSFYLYMVGEDKDETLGSGTNFSFTINDNADKNLQVQQVDRAGTAGGSGKEQGDTSIYETYIVDDVAPRILHYTKPDEDWAEVYYPTGESETYAEVYLTEADAILVSTPGTGGGSDQLGDVIAKDTEIAQVSSKNLIVIGGSCINSAAATILGVSQRTCGSEFTTATGVGSGQFLIKGVSGKFSTGKIALVVAGYDAADTVNAAKFLTTQSVDTSKEYKGTSATSAELVTTETTV